jgi:hypothetical protein
MRPSRSYRPLSLTMLEDRLVLSHGAAASAAMDVARPPADAAQTLSPSQMVPGAPVAPLGGNTFPMDIQQTLKAGQPVYEQQEVISSTGKTATLIDELIVPNAPTGGRTTTEWLDSAGSTDPSGVEKIVNIETVDGNTTTHYITTTFPGGMVQTEVKTIVKSGNSTTYTNVTTPLSGKVETAQYTDVQHGNVTIVKDASETPPPRDTGAINLSTLDGRIVKIKRGDKTIATETFAQPSIVKSAKTVVTSYGDAGQTKVETMQAVHNPTKTLTQNTIVWRLNPPAGS